MLRTIALACGICLTLAGKVADEAVLELLDGDLERTAPRRSIQEASHNELADCLWESSVCGLRQGFVDKLPRLIGQPVSESARILSRAALRASLCANYTGQPECLAAVQYNCKWDAAANSCGLADLLDIDALRAVGFCSGSPMEAAVQCALLSNSTAQECESSPYNCTIAAVSSAGFMSEMVLGSIGDRLYGMVTNTLLGMAVRSASAAGQLTSFLISLLGANLPRMDTQGCVARWTSDSSLLALFAKGVLDSFKNGDDLLSSLLTPSLLGSCNGTSRLQDALAACPTADTALRCAATAGCRWREGARSCAVGSDLLPALALNPSDAWVSAINNATAACRAAVDVAACSRVNATAAAIMGYSVPSGGPPVSGGATVVSRDQGSNVAVSLRASHAGMLVTALAVAVGMTAVRKYGL